MAMRVLHLIHSLGGGGAERQISYLVPRLVDFGVDVHVGYVSEGSNFDRLRKSRCTLHPITRFANYDPRLYLSISRLIGYLQPQLVQTWLPQMDVLGGCASGRRHIPYILSERNSAPAYKKNMKTRVRGLVGNRAAAIVANSMQGLDYWSFVDARVIKLIIPNGLAISDIDRIRAAKTGKSCHANDPNLLLFAGRYALAKNVELVMETFVEVAKTRGSIMAQFLGDGPFEDKLRARVADASLGSRIQVSGYSECLWKWLADASVFVSLSAYEGQPNIVLEAAAIGCPLVLSDIPAHREIFGEQAVKYVRDLTVAESAEAILSVLDDPRATQRRVAMARESVEKFSIDSCAVRYRDLYKQLLL